jgi:CDP-diacylglycerol--glycerol-3-phosphate 3-phosphatidyltransferase
LHTFANKATGAALFLVPFLIPMAGLAAPAAVCCSFASLSALEELAILIKSETLDRNAPGLFINPGQK